MIIEIKIDVDIITAYRYMSISDFMFF